MMTRKVISVILGALMIIAGVYCFFTPVETSTVIPFVLGIVMIGDGIGRIATWFDIWDIVRQSAWVLVSAVVSLIFGLMLVLSPVLQMSVGVFVILLTGWWILALGIIRIVHAFHLLKLKKESDGFGFSEMLGSNWWIALILGALLTIFGVIIILNPMLGLGVIGVLIGCGVITAGVNLIYLGCSPWILEPSEEKRSVRKKSGMSLLRKLDTRFGDNILWQFIKFNLVSFSITLLQLALANLLPLIFDGVAAKLPPVLRPVFQPDILFEGPSPYVVDGVVTWGYVLPFFLSNFIANIYGYFMNMKTTFRGKGSRRGLAAYLLILAALILFSTWLQGWITARLSATSFAALARTLAAMAAGLVQVAVLFPLEKYVLFRKE